MSPLDLSLWSSLLVGAIAAAAALYGRYRTLPASLTGPATCQLEAGGCKALFRTRDAALLGVPNSLLGLLFYAFLAAGLLLGWPNGLLLVAASLAFCMTLSLCRTLIRQHLECRICWTGHIANTLAFLLLIVKSIL